MALAAIILAGGASTRMGFPKALLDFRGASFVARVLDAVEALDIKTRVVVLGPDAARIRPVLASRDCVVVERGELTGGRTSSLHAALAALRSLRPSGALVWPVDRPHVRIATVERLIEAHGRADNGAVIPVFGARRGQPMILGYDQVAALWLLAPAGAQPDEPASWERDGMEVAVDDPAVVDPIDVPEDYERLVRGVNRDRC